MTEISHEINKDVKRLETITERFSKVGSKPKLKIQDVYEILNQTYYTFKIDYPLMYIKLKNQCNDSTAPINSTLFEWVVENICKNAADAMDGKGLLKSNYSVIQII